MMDVQLPLLKRREIEAQIAAALIEEYAQRFGREEALSVAAGVVRRLAREAGQNLAMQRGKNTLAELAIIAKEFWAEENALEIEFLKQSDTRLDFNVTRCRFAEMYAELGLKEFGFVLSCNRDHTFSQGFNPNIKLTRTQTIMQGHSLCDFRFELISLQG
jgi:predicted hydrocarbon binding protein